MLAGDNEAQIEALRDYLMVLGKAQALLTQHATDGTVSSAHDVIAAPQAN